MRLLPRLAIMFFVSIGCIGCDQTTKLLAKDLLQPTGSKSYLFDTFRLTYAENGGAFLGMGDSLPISVRLLIFQFAVSVILIALLLYIVRSDHLSALETTSFSLFLAGGSSNLFDRITNDGFVVDFLNVGVGPIRTGIFNIADVAILLGAIMLLLSQYRQVSTQPRE